MKTLATNRDRIIEQSVLGEVSPPRVGKGGQWRVSADGVPCALPGVGGITYNYKVGDSALDWEADHVEPGVSVRTENEEANNALNLLSCVGNTATVISGDAKGERGVVTGKHGGIEHVLVDFAQDTLERMAVGDKVQVRARGLGLKLVGAPEVTVLNLDPDLLERMGIEPSGDRLRVPVTHRVPAALMGSGLGQQQTMTGDYDVQMFDEKTVRENGLEDLRIGDIVAIMDHDHAYGRVYKTGAVSIGIVVHSRCVQAGHGPGVTTLLCSRLGRIVPVIDAGANIARYLKIGTERRRRGRRKA